MELSNDWHKRTNVRLADILSDILKETKPPKVPKPTHGYRIAEKAPEIVTAPGAYFPEKKGRVIPLESRQAGGPVAPARTLQQMLERLASYAPFPIPGAAGQSRAARERVEGQGENRLETAIEPKQLPLMPRQNGGEVDPNLFKEKFSVNLGDPTQQGIEAAANTASLKDTPLNVLPLTPLQSFAPGANSIPTGDGGKPTIQGDSINNPMEQRLNSISRGLSLMIKPPKPFKYKGLQHGFESEQRAAYDKKNKPYQDFMSSLNPTPLFSRDRGGSASPDPFEGLSKEERAKLLKLHGGHGNVIDLAPNASGTFEAKSTPPAVTEMAKKEETAPKTPTGSLSDIGKEIIPGTGETRYTIGDEEGGITVPRGSTFGEGNLQSFADAELEERKKWATPGYGEGQRVKRQKESDLESTKGGLPMSTVIGVSPGYEKTYYEAHPEERFMDRAREENKPLMDTYIKMIEQNRNIIKGSFGDVTMGRRAKREARNAAIASLPHLEQGLAQLQASNAAIPEKYFSSEIRAGKAGTPNLVQNEKGEYVHIYPPGTTGGKTTIAPTGVVGKIPAQDTSEWRTHEKSGQEKGWTRDQILADWDRKQIERTGKKAEITMNMATGGTSSFPNWDEATKRQSFDNFIINNQKPTFAWRDAKSRNTWEQEFNKYLIEKGKTAEGVGETRFYRGAQKKALDNNEVYRVAAERFVNVIDQNVELVKTLKKNYGMNYGKLVNTAANNIIQGIPGSGDLMSLQQVLISLSNEVAKVESGSMGVAEVSVEQAKIWKKVHDYNLNESDLDKVLDTSKQLGEIRRRSLRETTDALRKELGEKETKPGEVPKPSEGTNRPRAADFGGNPAEGVVTISKEEWVSRARKDERNKQYSDAALGAEYDKKYGGK